MNDHRNGLWNELRVNVSNGDGTIKKACYRTWHFYKYKVENLKQFTVQFNVRAWKFMNIGTTISMLSVFLVRYKL